MNRLLLLGIFHNDKWNKKHLEYKKATGATCSVLTLFSHLASRYYLVV
jgi:hypothetical protein